MPIVQQGAINTTALVVPDLYVQIVPPQNLVLNGVPTNRIGVVGTATWGPVNTPAIVGTMADYARQFGPLVYRKYDMGTQVAIAVQQGAADFRCVRVTDGTDTKATVTILTNCLTVTGLYSGSAGNGITFTISAAAKAGYSNVTVSMSGLAPEVFTMIPTGNATYAWQNIASAITNGNSALRGPSQIVTATAGVGTTAVANATYTLAGGADGATSITAATLIGADTLPRSGMYALRGQGCSIGLLADADDSTQWTTQAGFGLSEGLYMILVAPAGSAIANGTSGSVDLKAAAGLDSYGAKLMHGDWLYWNDQVNGVVRLVSPAAFTAGRLANLSPEQSSLNKPLYGVIGSQKSGVVGSGQMQTYASADISALLSAGIDVICNPMPGGTYWGVRGGHNSSSNAATNGDNYTRLTNYIAATLAAGMGLFVGQVINPDLLRRIRSTQLSFLQNMLSQGLLGLTVSGKLPFSVVCDATNNPDSRTSLGYVQSDAQIKYQAINEKFIVNVEGGQTVQVNRQTLPSGQAG